MESEVQFNPDNAIVKAVTSLKDEIVEILDLTGYSGDSRDFADLWDEPSEGVEETKNSGG